MYRKRSFRRPRRKILRRRAGKKGSVSTKIKKYVSRAIHKQIENKEIIAYGSNSSLTTGTAGVAPTNLGLIPTISQGTANNQRIGDAIRIRRGIVSGTVHLKPYDATENPRAMPVYVKMWVVRLLSTTSQLGALPAGSTDYMFKGNGANLPPQGNLLDLDLPINQEKFRVLGRTKICRLGVCGYSALGPVSTTSWYDNSTMTCRFSFNWGKYTKKLLKFSEEDAGVCTNDNCYLVWQTVYANGDEADGYKIVQASYVNKIDYEDA